MLQKLKQQRNGGDRVASASGQQGFTIIEVMIVLAIAGLIMVVVFLAVPALQRSSRNTQRRTDVNNALSSISNYIANNGGALPTTSATLTTAIQDAKLGYYTSAQVFYQATLASAVYATSNGGTASATSVTTEGMVFVPGAICTSPTTPTTTGASSRSYVLLYEVEGGSAPTPQCQQGG